MPEIIATHLDNAMGLSDRKLAAPNSSHNSTTDAATVQVRPIQYCTHKKLKLKILAKSDQN